jgi:hypothetical protein
MGFTCIMMSDGEASDVQIEEVGLAWLQYHATQDESDEWPLNLVDKWIRAGRIADVWRFIKDVCRRVGQDDLPLISNIGTGPLESFVGTFGDQAIDLIEPELGNNPPLLAALAMVLRRDTPIRLRIDRVLAEHGQERPDLIERASTSWLATAAADKYSDEWVDRLQLEWIDTGQWECMWRFILRLCEIVDPKNKEIVDKIGVDPMVSLIFEFPDQMLQAIEDVAEQQPTVIEALSIVMGDTKELDARIDEVLARCGKPRE